MDTYALPKKTLFLWQVRVAVLGALIIALISLVIDFFLGNFNWIKWIYFTITALLVFAVFVYIPLYFKGYKIIIEPTAVMIESGVIIRARRIMPFSRLLYAQSLSSPLARILGLSAMSLKATRSRVFIPEIESRIVESVVNNLTSEDAK